jgi:hypothetical protein
MPEGARVAGVIDTSASRAVGSATALISMRDRFSGCWVDEEATATGLGEPASATSAFTGGAAMPRREARLPAMLAKTEPKGAAESSVLARGISQTGRNSRDVRDFDKRHHLGTNALDEDGVADAGCGQKIINRRHGLRVKQGDVVLPLSVSSNCSTAVALDLFLRLALLVKPFPRAELDTVAFGPAARARSLGG